MSKPTRAGHPIYSLLPREVEGFDSLAELALDMRWSWNHCADEVWRQLDPALWELTRNPWVVLQTVSREHIERTSGDPEFRRKVDALVQTRRQSAEAPAWFQQTYSQSPLSCVAYFSMEFMLSEALPIYSGGLGTVAGDQLKASGDLGAPLRREMTRGEESGGAKNGYVYSAQVPATRAAADFTARVIPHRAGIAVPLESARILWQR